MNPRLLHHIGAGVAGRKVVNFEDGNCATFVEEFLDLFGILSLGKDHMIKRSIVGLQMDFIAGLYS
jgi:hypothetical protein